MSYQVTNGRFQALVSGGAPLVGGRLYTYVSGTTTFKTTYTDATLGTPNTYTADGAGGQYIALNARGEATLWLGSGVYTLALKDATGVGVWSVDGIVDPAGATVDLTNNLAASAGASLVGFIQAGGSAVARTMQDKGRERISLEDFGAVGDFNGTTGADNLAALNAAIASLPSFGGVIELGYGRYRVSVAPTISALKHVTIRGKGSSESDNDVGASELVISSGTLTFSAPKCKLQDMVVRGAPGHTGDLVHVIANGFQALDVSFYGAGQDGLRVGSDTDVVNANNGSLVNCAFFANGRHGYYFNDVGPSIDANGWTISNCLTQGNGGDGARLANAHLNSLIGGVYENNTGCGIRMVSGANYNKIVGGDYEGNAGTAEISVEAGAVFNSIDVATVFYGAINDAGTVTQINAPDASNEGWVQKGSFRMLMGNSGAANDLVSGDTGGYIRMLYGGDAFTDANAHVLLGGTGVRIGKSTAGAVGFFDKTPIAKQDTGAGAASFVDAGATTVHTSSTFDGYTLGQIVRALRLYGLLA